MDAGALGAPGRGPLAKLPSRLEAKAVKARLRQRLRRIRHALHRERLHPRVAGEPSAYYFDPAELGATTTSSTDETW